jgi:cell fate (sporulation/competence/biofilm development) regulator YlbF (YheA/YmcA/DUF963 family)
MVLVPPRNVANIDADLADADAALAEAISAASAATSARDAANANIAAKKVQLVEAKRQRDTAKKTGQEAGAATLDSTRKGLERELDLLEQRAALRDAEIDLAQRTGELATLNKRMLSFERELALKRLESDTSSASGPERSSLTRVTLDLAAQTLNAQVAHANKAVDVATRQKRVAERLLQILDAQRRVLVN